MSDGGTESGGGTGSCDVIRENTPGLYVSGENTLV